MLLLCVILMAILQVEASVLSIVYAQQKVFVAMANSSLAIFKRDRDEWDWEGYKVTYLGRNRDVPISVMVAVKHRIWCGVGNRVYVVDANTNQIEVRSCKDLSPVFEFAAIAVLFILCVHTYASV